MCKLHVKPHEKSLRRKRHLNWRRFVHPTPLLVTHKTPFLHSCISRATTASPKPSVRATWRVDNAMVCRENDGWTTSKTGRSTLQLSTMAFPQERPEEGIYWIVPLVFPTTQSVNGLKLTLSSIGESLSDVISNIPGIFHIGAACILCPHSRV